MYIYPQKNITHNINLLLYIMYNKFNNRESPAVNIEIASIY